MHTCNYTQVQYIITYLLLRAQQKKLYKQPIPPFFTSNRMCVSLMAQYNRGCKWGHMAQCFLKIIMLLHLFLSTSSTLKPAKPLLRDHYWHIEVLKNKSQYLILLVMLNQLKFSWTLISVDVSEANGDQALTKPWNQYDMMWLASTSLTALVSIKSKGPVWREYTMNFTHICL